MLEDGPTTSDDSQEPNVNPDESRLDEYGDTRSTGLKIAAVLFVLVAAIAGGYGWVQHDAVRQLAAERADLRASLDQAKIQAESLTAKVNALSAAQAQQAQQAQEELAARAQVETVTGEQFLPRTQEASRHVVHRAVAHRTPVEDPRWKQVQQQLGDQQKLLADNQKQLADDQKQIADAQADLKQAKTDMEGDLQSARTELSGGIARNHAEVVVLERKGERNFYEFSFEKSKTYHHAGPVSISLRKADSKHGFCDLQLVVDDRTITRKHVNLYESLSFYPDGYSQPIELVINHVDDNSVKGYISEPKFRSTTEQASTATPPAPATSAAVNPPAPAPAPAAPDVKLDHRDDAAH
jgi:hypothetical protein